MQPEAGVASGADTQPEADTQLEAGVQPEANSEHVIIEAGDDTSRGVQVEQQKRFGDWENVDFRQQDNKHVLKQSVLDAISSIGYEDREQFGHDIEDMLLSCSWEGYSCGPA